jgi:hypothetical protein
LAAAIRKLWPDAEIELVGGGRGVFIVIGNSALLWDKRGREGRFPEEDEILDQLAE